jgi:nitrite reductase/ring-hydroxylating ferredoxin subunit/uncharacterized membrane protein
MAMADGPETRGDGSHEGAEGASVATSAVPAPRPPLVDRISDPLQHAIGAVIGSSRKPPRLLKSLLNGTWFGHPLHPAITDVPVVAWLLTALFDIIWLLAPATNAWAGRAALATVIVGLLGALGAIVTGMADWSDSYGRERTVGFLHGLTNLGATVLYAVSIWLRFTVSANESLTAAVLGFVGLVLVLYAAYLGGEMVFTHGTSVNHTAWEAAGEDYEPVMALRDVAEHTLYRVTAAGVPVVLTRTGDRLCALSATCPHAGGPLDEGSLEGGVVTCPWHGSRFRMCDGRVLTGPATVNAPRYDVRVRDGQVEVKRSGGGH